MRAAITLPFLGAALLTAGALAMRAIFRPEFLDRIRARGF